MKLLAPIVILIVAAFVLIPQAFYKVDETEHIVLTRFGEIRGIQSSPGLKMKVPFIDVANVLDKRLLRVDVPELASLIFKVNF